MYLLKKLNAENRFSTGFPDSKIQTTTEKQRLLVSVKFKQVDQGKVIFSDTSKLDDISIVSNSTFTAFLQKFSKYSKKLSLVCNLSFHSQLFI